MSDYEKIIKIMCLGDGKTPNANGRIYSQEIINQMVDKLNESETYVTYPTDTTVDVKDILGVVKKAKKKGSGIECELSVFNKDEFFVKDGFLSPTGIGSINENTNKVNDYKLISVSISASPAFYQPLDFDDLDFDEILSFVDGDIITGLVNSPKLTAKQCVLRWAADKGFRLSKDDTNKLTLILEELI